ncbi:MAG TPA: hypothetical protein VIJ14_01005 [Rhabdochlamydiaceae bacterium]
MFSASSSGASGSRPTKEQLANILERPPFKRGNNWFYFNPEVGQYASAPVDPSRYYGIPYQEYESVLRSIYPEEGDAENIGLSMANALSDSQGQEELQAEESQQTTIGSDQSSVAAVVAPSVEAPKKVAPDWKKRREESDARAAAHRAAKAGNPSYGVQSGPSGRPNPVSESKYREMINRELVSRGITPNNSMAGYPSWEYKYKHESRNNPIKSDIDSLHSEYEKDSNAYMRKHFPRPDDSAALSELSYKNRAHHEARGAGAYIYPNFDPVKHGYGSWKGFYEKMAPEYEKQTPPGSRKEYKGRPGVDESQAEIDADRAANPFVSDDALEANRRAMFNENLNKHYQRAFSGSARANPVNQPPSSAPGRQIGYLPAYGNHRQHHGDNSDVQDMLRHVIHMQSMQPQTQYVQVRPKRDMYSEVLNNFEPEAYNFDFYPEPGK